MLKLVEGVAGWSIQHVERATGIPLELAWISKLSNPADVVQSLYQTMADSYRLGYEEGYADHADGLPTTYTT